MCWFDSNRPHTNVRFTPESGHSWARLSALKKVGSSSVNPVLLCSIITNPARRPAWPSEVASAPLLAGESHHVFLWRRQRVVVVYGARLQPMGRHRPCMLNRSETRTGNRIGNVVVATRRMIDAVTAAARGAPLKRQELLPHAAMVEQRNRAAV